MKRASRIFGALLIAVAIVLGGYFLWAAFAPVATPPPETSVVTPEPPTPETDLPAILPVETEVEVEPPESPSEEMPDELDGLPVGKLVITPERKSYQDGNLTIMIPVINITRTIYDGTDATTLNRGVGLYEYAQLPGEGNRNVSVAGHRNGLSNGKVTDRAPFYYIDTLTKGDYLYLCDSENIYCYLWEYCEIIEPDDWSPIRTAGYSCLTITSCHPIGISDHRIVVRGKLDKIIPYDKNYAFPPTIEEVP